MICYVPLSNQKIVSEYDSTCDVVFYYCDVIYFELNESIFAIFYTDDLHKSCVRKERTMVKKDYF